MAGEMAQGFDRGGRRLTSVHRHINARTGAISRALGAQAAAVRRAARRAEDHQARLFRRAQEEARYQQRQGRRCAEVLAKHGHYPWLSGCP
jgi:hypothetical protein